MEDIRWSREETWNKWEKIPFVNFAAGGFRAFAGGVGQVILSVALMAIYAIGNLFTLGYFNLGRRSLKQSLYAVHGLANIFRGMFQLVPIVGYVTLLYYDKQGWRFRYPLEKTL